MENLYYHSIPEGLKFDYITKPEIIQLFHLFEESLGEKGYASLKEHRPGEKLLITPLNK